MSEIVIRHAETRDYEAIRQIHAQPEVYCNTLQVPHPSDHMWQERLADRPGIKQLVACIDGDVVGHLTIDVQQHPRRSHVADFGICVDSRWKNRGVASALMREMIEMCDNWLRVDRIELTVFVDNAPAIKVYTAKFYRLSPQWLVTSMTADVYSARRRWHHRPPARKCSVRPVWRRNHPSDY